MRKLTKKEVLEYTPFTPQAISDILATNDEQVKKALLKLFEFQTIDERTHEMTKYVNNVGFSGCDGEILSSFAKQLTRNNFLSEKQMVILRKKMQKYCFQLARIANASVKQKVVVNG